MTHFEYSCFFSALGRSIPKHRQPCANPRRDHGRARFYLFPPIIADSGPRRNKSSSESFTDGFPRLGRAGDDYGIPYDTRRGSAANSAPIISRLICGAGGAPEDRGDSIGSAPGPSENRPITSISMLRQWPSPCRYRDAVRRCGSGIAGPIPIWSRAAPGPATCTNYCTISARNHGGADRSLCR